MTASDPRAQRQADLWDLWAARYDNWHAGNDADATVKFLLDQTSEGRILELGIGTGRVALGIARTGRPVEGIDVSEAMLGELRKKTGELPVVARRGNMVDVDVDGSFSLIYCAASTFFHITDQQQQVDCFRNVSAKLSVSGRFVIEAFIPPPEMLSPARSLTLRDFNPESLRFSATIADRLTQRIQFQEVVMTSAGNQFLPAEQRFCWPSELDLMAQLAGMELAERYAAYTREPLNHRSPQHVSVYVRADGTS